jgi:hypothetical protein
MQINSDGVVSIASHCLYCLSAEHRLNGCPEKYDFFPLTSNDQQFLRQCGIRLPWDK